MNNYLEEDEGINLSTFNKQKEIESFNDVKTKGFQLLVRLYIPSKKIGSIILPNESHEQFQFKSCVGLVVQKGPVSYGKRFDFLKADKAEDQTSQEWCQVGDWIVFARHEGIQMKIHGKPCQFLNDSSVLAVIDNPEMIIR